jgi:hypothetical protein
VFLFSINISLCSFPGEAMVFSNISCTIKTTTW